MSERFVTRRDFIGKTAAGLAGIAIGGLGFSPKSYAVPEEV